LSELISHVILFSLFPLLLDIRIRVCIGVNIQPV